MLATNNKVCMNSGLLSLFYKAQEPFIFILNLAQCHFTFNKATMYLMERSSPLCVQFLMVIFPKIFNIIKSVIHSIYVHCTSNNNKNTVLRDFSQVLYSKIFYEPILLKLKLLWMLILWKCKLIIKGGMTSKVIWGQLG